MTDITVGKKRKKRFLDHFIRSFEKFLSKHPFLSRGYTRFFWKMTVDEFSIVSLPEQSKILNIGCGSLPHTLFTLAVERGWKFIGIDIDPIAVQRAKKMVNYYKLSELITIKEGDGVQTDFSGFDMILVSHGVEPKYTVLEIIAKKIQPHCLIFYRTTWDSLDKVYGDEPIPKSLCVKKTFNRIDGIKAYLLVRNENNI